MRSRLYSELRAAEEARLFAKIDRMVLAAFVVLCVGYVAFEIIRTL